MAAVVSAVRERTIIFGHLLPSFLSYIIVSLTLAIPATACAMPPIPTPEQGLARRGDLRRSAYRTARPRVADRTA